MNSNRHDLAPTTSPWLPKGALATTLLLLIVLAGLLLRFYLPPWAPIHSNSHGIEKLRVLLDPSEPSSARMFYGYLFPYVMEKLLSLFGSQEQVIFAANSVFGALSVWSLFALARALRLGQSAALFAAFVLAFSPGHIWVSGSEVASPLYQLLLTTALVFTLRSVHTDDPAKLWVAALLATLASALRVTTLLAIPAIIAAYIFARWTTPGNLQRHGPHPWLALLCSGWFAVVHFSHLTWTFGGYAGHTFENKFLTGLTTGNTLLDPTLTVPIVPLLALLGLAFLVFVRPRQALLLTGLFLALMGASLLVNSYRTDAVRYQASSYWPMFLLAAIGMSSLTQSLRSGNLQRLGLYTATVFFVVIHLLWAAPVIHQGTILDREYRFIRNTLPQLPDDATIVVADLDCPNKQLLSSFPDFLGPQDCATTESVPPDTDDVIIYLGTSCYKEVTQDWTTPGLEIMRDECLEICEGGDLEPVETKTIVHKPIRVGDHRTGHALSTRNIEIGFYTCENSPSGQNVP